MTFDQQNYWMVSS